MMDGKPCDLTWTPVPDGVPVMGLSQTRDDNFLVCMLGVVRYKDDQAEEVATHFEAVADLIRRKGHAF